MTQDICIQDGCEDPRYAKQQCLRHYRREYMRNLIRRRRAEWVAAQGGRCVACGSTERLEIDHVDPALKEREVGTLWALRAETRERELAKCQLLCRDCHEAKTLLEQQGPHGTRGRYKNGCRCDECRTHMAERNRSYRRQKTHAVPAA